MAAFKSHPSDLYQSHRFLSVHPQTQVKILSLFLALHTVALPVMSQLLNPFLCTRLSATVLAERIFLVFHHASAQTCPSLLRGGWWVLKPPHYCFASLDFRCAMVSLASESGMPKHFVICSTSRSGGLVRHFFQKAESHCGCGDL